MCWTRGHHSLHRHGNWLERKTLNTGGGGGGGGGGEGGSGGMPPSPPPPQKIKVYAIWGYPEVIFVEIISTFFVRTATDWNDPSDDQVKAPTFEDFKRRIATPSTTMRTPLPSHRNRKLGPATYEIKISNCNITKLSANAVAGFIFSQTSTSAGILPP